MREVNGEFTVKITPVDTGDARMGMMMLDKEYLGDLAGAGKGRMLTGMSEVKGSAAYVAIERFEGTLHQAKGSFLLQHTGVMSKAGQSLVITIVPDSGTGELVGIEGKLQITITGGKHFYKLEYSLGAK
jgi:hypothetical protein